MKDAAGSPLSGASIKVEGTNKGTFSDNAGRYTLKLTPGSWQLIVGYIGHAPQTIPVTVTDGGTVEQDITLTEAAAVQESVVVVGSRNPKRSATDGPVPVDVIPLKQIANEVGQLDVTQLLTYLAPSFNSVRQALGDGTDHIDPAQLRGLGPDQVLVLVNGKRQQRLRHCRLYCAGPLSQRLFARRELKGPGLSCQCGCKGQARLLAPGCQRNIWL